MKKTTSILYTFLLSGLLLAGCNKDEPEPNNNNNNTNTVKQNDQAGSTEADEAIDDVNDFINNKIGGGSEEARMTGYNLPCGVVKVDSATTNGTGKTIYKLHYGNNTPCGYKKKSGSVSFELVNGNKFQDTGAVVKITFTDYVVEVIATGATVKLNGTISVTNIDGGYIWQAVTISRVIKHKVRGSFNITYANNEVRTRNYYQLRTWSSNNGWTGLTFTVAGDTTISIHNNLVSVSETGKTYEGNYDFQTEIIEAFSWSNCGTSWAGPYVLKTGNAKMHVTIPTISTSFINVEAGYKMDVADLTATPVKVNDCNSNAYKITSQLGTISNTQYQLY